jgi:nucleoid DNA-binding protein
VNTTDLAEAIHDRHGFNRAESRRILDSILETIRTEIKRGGRVRLRNFGVFKPRDYYGKTHCVFDDSKNFFS